MSVYYQDGPGHLPHCWVQENEYGHVRCVICQAVGSLTLNVSLRKGRGVLLVRGGRAEQTPRYLAGTILPLSQLEAGRQRVAEFEAGLAEVNELLRA